MNKLFQTIFSDKYSAYTFLWVIVLYIICFGYFRGQQIFSIPLNILSISILIPILLIDGLKIMIESLSHKQYFQAKEDLSKVTVIIPTKDGADTLIPTLNDLTKRFNKQSIIVASNGSTDNTVDIANEFGVRVVDIEKGVGKATAINMALSEVTTPYTLVIDDDTLVGEAVMPTNILDEGYEAAAFRVLPIKEGWLSILQLHEYRKSMDIGRCYHNSNGSVQSISGAIGLFHTKELERQIELHSGEFSGEDLQRTLLVLVAEKRKGVVIVDSLVETFVPKTINELFHQRILGWNPGHFANIKLYIHLIFGKNVNFKLRFEAFFSIFIVAILDPIRLIALPVLLFSPAYLTIFVIAYILLESIPWLSMGRKEPFWVILVSPIYGLFNFVTRILSLATFTYRRLTYFIAKAEKFDDYRHAPLNVRFISFIITVLIYALIMSSYSFFGILPVETKKSIEKQFSEVVNLNNNMITSNTLQEVIVLNQQIKKVEAIDNKPQDANQIYTTIILQGDSLWKLSDILIAQYQSNHNIVIEPKIRNVLIARLVEVNKNKKIKTNEYFSMNEDEIDSTLLTLIEN